MPLRITRLLDIIGDGKWHKIEQLRERLGLSEYEVQEMTQFLSQFNFAEFEENAHWVRINKDFRKILLTT